MSLETLPQMSGVQIENFWKGVAKHAGQGPLGECWEWQRSTVTGGYGKFGLNHKFYRSHRMAYKLAYGADPGELCVLHKCDNPPCCNPAHFFLGTKKDNALDRAAKRRAPVGDEHWSRKHPEKVARGESQGGVKVTIADVRAIRQRIDAGESSYVVAKDYNIGQMTAWKIGARRTWKHID